MERRSEDRGACDAGGAEPVADMYKLRDLAHYVIWRAGEDDGCAAIRLYQVLWCAEINNYVRSGQLLSGVKYVRSRHGLRPICWDEIRERLEADSAIRAMPDGEPSADASKFIAIRAPGEMSLSESEIGLVDFWIDNAGGFLGGRRSAVFSGGGP
jgi:hypothetical protein